LTTVCCLAFNCYVIMIIIVNYVFKHLGGIIRGNIWLSVSIALEIIVKILLKHF
jgi:hypothetical protein